MERGGGASRDDMDAADKRRFLRALAPKTRTQRQIHVAIGDFPCL